jgi:hypothetical protein
MNPKKKVAHPTLSGRPYQAYLVRCWQEGGNWRFSLETVGCETDRRGFNAFQDLADYLREQFAGLGSGKPTD